MRLVQSDPILVNGDMSQPSLTSNIVQLQWRFVTAIQCEFTGSPNGTFQVQASTDYADGSINSFSPSNPGTWTTLSGSCYDVTEAGDLLYNITDIGFPYCRIVYTSTSGSGTLNIISTTKGV